MGRRTGVRVQERAGTSKVSLEPAADRTTNERQYYDPSAFSSRSICTDASFGCGVYGIRLRPGLILPQVGEGWGTGDGDGAVRTNVETRGEKKARSVEQRCGVLKEKGTEVWRRRGEPDRTGDVAVSAYWI